MAAAQQTWEAGRAADTPGGLLRPFDELAVGDRYTSKRRTITETDVVRFATLTGAAATTVAAAHDLLPLTYSIGLVPNAYVNALRRIVDLRLLRPVAVGDTIHVRCEIVRLDEWTDDYGLVAGAWTIVDQDDQMAMEVELEAIWRRARL